MSDDLKSKPAYDWEQKIDKPNEDGGGGKFKLLPPGIYPFKVTKPIEKSRYDGNANIPPCPMAIVTIECGSSEVGFSEVQDRHYLHPVADWKACQFFRSLGLRKHGDPLDLSLYKQILGRGGYCELEHGTGKKGDKKFNNIKAWMDPDDAPKADTGTTDQQGFDWGSGVQT